jgi:hypothetical protein
VPDLGGDDQVRVEGGDLLQVRLGQGADGLRLGAVLGPVLAQVVRQLAVDAAVVGVADDRGVQDQGGVDEARVQGDDALRLGRDLGLAHRVVDGAREARGRRRSGGFGRFVVGGPAAPCQGEGGHSEQGGQSGQAHRGSPGQDESQVKVAHHLSEVRQP